MAATGKRRGRPPKAESVAPRRRGRPRKSPLANPVIAKAANETAAMSVSMGSGGDQQCWTSPPTNVWRSTTTLCGPSGSGQLAVPMPPPQPQLSHSDTLAMHGADLRDIRGVLDLLSSRIGALEMKVG